MRLNSEDPLSVPADTCQTDLPAPNAARYPCMRIYFRPPRMPPNVTRESHRAGQLVWPCGEERLELEVGAGAALAHHDWMFLTVCLLHEHEVDCNCGCQQASRGPQ